LDENKARWFFQQLILALDYCHKMNISNRDIKLENTLLHSQGADRRPMVKLCDFGGAPFPGTSDACAIWASSKDGAGSLHQVMGRSSVLLC